MVLRPVASSIRQLYIRLTVRPNRVFFSLSADVACKADFFYNKIAKSAFKLIVNYITLFSDIFLKFLNRSKLQPGRKSEKIAFCTNTPAFLPSYWFSILVYFFGGMPHRFTPKVAREKKFLTQIFLQF